MEQLRFFELCLVLVLVISSVTGQIVTTPRPDVDGAQDANVYILGFMNISMDRPEMKGFQQIIVSSWEDTVVRIEIPFIGIDEYFSLTSQNGRRWTREIDTDLATAKNEGVRKKGVRISSLKALNVQAVKSKQATTDGFQALQITDDAKEFFVMSAGAQPGEHSAFVVAAVFPNTCLEAYIVNGNNYRKLRGLIQLQEFDIYQLESDSIDMTGVYINASKPLAVFGGHECAEEPLRTRFCDHTIAQVPPITEWGTSFNVAPIKDRLPASGYALRVIAGYDDTSMTISVNGHQETLNRGNFVHANITNSQASTQVTCSKPCMVTQHNRSWKYVEGDIQTDSFVTLIPPTNHYVNNVTFRTAKFWDDGSKVEFQKNYVAVVAPSGQLDRITLDGAVITSPWQYVTNSYSLAEVEIEPGFHVLSNNNPRSSLMGYVYGHAMLLPSGYGYPVGYRLDGKRVKGPWNHFFTTAAPPLGPCDLYRPLAGDPRFVFGVLADLRFAERSTCAVDYQTVLQGRTKEVIQRVNELICHGLLCKQFEGDAVVTYDISWLENGVSLTGVDLDVSVITSLDARAVDLYSCRKQVLDALGNSAWWRFPQPIAGCAILDFTTLQIKPGGPGGIVPGNGNSGQARSGVSWQCPNIGIRG